MQVLRANWYAPVCKNINYFRCMKIVLDTEVIVQTLAPFSWHLLQNVLKASTHRLSKNSMQIFSVLIPESSMYPLSRSEKKIWVPRQPCQCKITTLLTSKEKTTVILKNTNTTTNQLEVSATKMFQIIMRSSGKTSFYRSWSLLIYKYCDNWSRQYKQ